MGDFDVHTLLGHFPPAERFFRVSSRMLSAVVLGAIIGIQRELMGEPAGLRTHALVSLAAAIVTVVALEAGMNLDGISRVIQGIATGIGFIGAGVILKRHEEGEVIGLTTAASGWRRAKRSLPRPGSTTCTWNSRRHRTASICPRSM